MTLGQTNASLRSTDILLLELPLLIIFSDSSWIALGQGEMQSLLCHDTLHSDELLHCSPPVQLTVHLTVVTTSTACCLQLPHVSPRRPHSQQQSWEQGQISSRGVVPVV